MDRQCRTSLIRLVTFGAFGLQLIACKPDASPAVATTSAALTNRTAGPASDTVVPAEAAVPVPVVRPLPPYVFAPPPPNHTFLVKSYDGTKRCLDYGAPAGVPAGGGVVFLNDCALAHPISVQEIDAQHDVILHAGNLVIGVNVPTTALDSATYGRPQPAPVYSLELQAPADRDISTSSNQFFTLDGDSIIFAKSRPCFNTDSAPLCGPAPTQLVVQVQNAQGAIGTPLVVAARHLNDSEFWDFEPTAGSTAYPTTGFVQVSTNYDLWNQVCESPVASASGPPRNADGSLAPCASFKAGPGSVIEIASPSECNNVGGTNPGDTQNIGACIDLSAYPPLVLPSGVTLRGDRRGINPGPQLFAAIYSDRGQDSGSISNCGTCMLQIHGDYVRVTGLRLRGKSRDKQINDGYVAKAIDVDSPVASERVYASVTEYIASIDHNDMSDWEGADVEVLGGRSEPYTQSCELVENDQGTQDNLRIERNFLHHNEKWGDGYGTVMSRGGRAVIQGNTFLENRHSISADSEAHEQYRAWYNLVLSSVPDYSIFETGNLKDHGPQQDFDMHGEFKGYGGIGGNQVDIAGNTFLGGNRYNFELRGLPCVYVDYFRNNVTQDADGTVGGQNVINLHNIGAPVGVTKLGPYVVATPVVLESYQPRVANSGEPSILEINNQYPPASLDLAQGAFGVGDFDGDGVDDLFLATGSAWYFSPHGAAEWRFLSAKPDKMGALLFGDFDGDGRTEVVGISGNDLMISWGGVSDWQVLNTLPAGASISDLAVGDFDGDGRSDIFYANGTSWYVSYGGTGSFDVVNTSSFRGKDLRFGDFDGDGQTDVFAVAGNSWSYSKSARASWASGFLQEALAPVAGLVVADFNGDGIADVATSSYNNWTISYGGRGNWVHIAINDTSACPSPEPPLAQLPAIGRFDGNPGADVLLWNGGNELCIVSGATVGLQPYSTQDMR